MYYTNTYEEDPKSIEMSFDCTNYQHQFRLDEHDDMKPKDPSSGDRPETCVAPVPYDKHIFQSIFLDKSRSQLWTIDQIDESKIIERKWWHQLGHRWQHYTRVVPGM
ncbi:hypothetical protein LPUS_09317, partial [Lasallia pustulata]